MRLLTENVLLYLYCKYQTIKNKLTMDIDYKISVMQAYRDGAEIECIDKHVSDDIWEICDNPGWNWTKCDYRVKPSPKYRPYNNTTEFLIMQKEHGPYLCINKEKHTFIIPTSVVIGGVEFTQLGESITYGWELLFKNFTWQDGTPCGVKE